MEETEITLKRTNGALITGRISAFVEQIEGRNKVLVFEFWSRMECFSYSVNVSSEEETKEYLDQFEV